MLGDVRSLGGEAGHPARSTSAASASQVGWDSRMQRLEPHHHRRRAEVREVEPTRTVDGEGVGADRDGEGRPTAPEAVALAVAGYRCDATGARLHTADAVIAPIGDVQVALRVDGDTARFGEERAGGIPAVAGEARASGAGHGDDAARGHVDPADAMRIGLGDEEVARGVARELYQPLDRGARRRLVLAPEARHPRARDRTNAAPHRLDAPDARAEPPTDEQ